MRLNEPARLRAGSIVALCYVSGQSETDTLKELKKQDLHHGWTKSKIKALRERLRKAAALPDDEPPTPGMAAAFDENEGIYIPFADLVTDPATLKLANEALKNEVERLRAELKKTQQGDDLPPWTEGGKRWACPSPVPHDAGIRIHMEDEGELRKTTFRVTNDRSSFIPASSLDFATRDLLLTGECHVERLGRPKKPREATKSEREKASSRQAIKSNLVGLRTDRYVETNSYALSERERRSPLEYAAGEQWPRERIDKIRNRSAEIRKAWDEEHWNGPARIVQEPVQMAWEWFYPDEPTDPGPEPTCSREKATKPELGGPDGKRSREEAGPAGHLRPWNSGPHGWPTPGKETRGGGSQETAEQRGQRVKGTAILTKAGFDQWGKPADR